MPRCVHFCVRGLSFGQATAAPAPQLHCYGPALREASLQVWSCAGCQKRAAATERGACCQACRVSTLLDARLYRCAGPARGQPAINRVGQLMNGARCCGPGVCGWPHSVLGVARFHALCSPDRCAASSRGLLRAVQRPAYSVVYRAKSSALAHQSPRVTRQRV